MPTIGQDCQIILDGNGYWIEPDSFVVDRPSVASFHSAGGGAAEANIDFGIAKKRWRFTIAAFQAIKDYTGTTVSTTGQAYRTNLDTSFKKVNTTLSFTDPTNTSFSVRFAEFTEQLDNARAQPDSELQYYCHVTLVEATDITVTLDSTSYWMVPGSFSISRPHAGSGSSASSGHPESQYDWEHPKREFSFSLVALSADVTSLQASFDKSNTSLSFTDPAGQNYTVRIGELSIDLAEKRADGTLQYYAHLLLRESRDLTITLDSSSYSLVPGSWQERYPHAGAGHSAASGHPEEQYDWEHPKKELSCTLLALTGDLTNLRATFNKSNTSVSLTDPAGTVFPAVRIAQLTVELAEARTDGTLLSYAHLILRESHDLTLTLDGSSYSYLPGTWQERRPHAASSHSAGAGHPEEEYEWAAAKREWEFTLLALSADLTTLRASFNKSLTILNFTDPLGSSLSGRFQDLLVELAEVRTDGTALYYAHCILRESILVTVPLDGNTYTLLPGSWQERRPRVSTAQLNRLVASGGSGVGERFTDSGPAKREWFFTAVCLAADVANLTASYEKVNTTLVWGDYNGTNRNVHFDDLVLELAEITTAAVDWFYAHCTLREA